MGGITVLIPHYGEVIIMEKKELWSPEKLKDKENQGPTCSKKLEQVPLIEWLHHKYETEFKYFASRMTEMNEDSDAEDMVEDSGKKKEREKGLRWAHALWKDYLPEQ